MMQGRGQFSCIPCDKYFTGIECLQAHIKSEKHIRKNLEKDRQELYMSNTDKSNESNHDVPSLVSDNVKCVKNFEMKCDICDIVCSGLACYEQHTISIKHKKNVARKMLQAKNGENETTQMLPKNAASFQESSVISSEITCSTCSIKYSGFESYQAHMKGCQEIAEGNEFSNNFTLENEKLPLLQNKIVEQPKSSLLNSEVFAYCEMCKKRFSGPEPYSQHLHSIGHKKKIEQKKLLSNNTMPDLKQSVNGEGIASPQSFSCSECSKSFNGIIPYQMHMDSEAHRKGIRKHELMGKIKSTLIDYRPTAKLEPSIIKTNAYMNEGVLANNSQEDMVGQKDINKPTNEMASNNDSYLMLHNLHSNGLKGDNQLEDNAHHRLDSQVEIETQSASYDADPSCGYELRNGCDTAESIYTNIKIYNTKDLKVTVFEPDMEITFKEHASASPDLIKDISPS